MDALFTTVTIVKNVREVDEHERFDGQNIGFIGQKRPRPV
jgi:hypothetical protein